MDLTEAERDVLAPALAARRTEQELSRRIRREVRVERGLRALADRVEHDAFARGLLTAAGIDAADAQRRRERNTAEARAVLERQRRTIAEQSGAIAERHRAQALARARAEERAAGQGAGAYQLTTLDTASAIWTTHSSADANDHVDVHVDPPAPTHNVAKVYQSRVTSPDIRFHVPGFWIVAVHWAFRFPVADNVLLNAVTFVRALGADSLFASGWVFGDSFARIDFTTRLDLFAVGAPPLQQVRSIGTGDQDEGPVRFVHSDWWDLLGQFDGTVFDFQSTLIDNGLSAVGAGSTVFVIVTATLDLSADGNAFCVADFLDGQLQINVPSVFVSTFPDNPIP